MNPQQVTQSLISIVVGALLTVAAAFLGPFSPAAVRTGAAGERAEITSVDETSELCSDLMDFGDPETCTYTSATVHASTTYVLSTLEQGAYVRLESTIRICEGAFYYDLDSDYSYKTHDTWAGGSASITLYMSNTLMMFRINDAAPSEAGVYGKEFEKVVGRWVILYEEIEEDGDGEETGEETGAEDVTPDAEETVDPSLAFGVIQEICPFFMQDLEIIDSLSSASLVTKSNFKNNDGLYTMRTEGESTTLSNPFDKFVSDLLRSRTSSLPFSDSFYSEEYDGQLTINLTNAKKPLVKYNMVMDKSRDYQFVKYSEISAYTFENINSTTVEAHKPVSSITALEFLEKTGRD